MSPSQPAQSLRVLIVDQHEVSRAAIRALLRTEGLQVVGDVSSGTEALSSGEASSPNIVLVDIGAPPWKTLETARVLAGLRSAPTVVLTSSAPPVIDLGGFAFIAKGDICARQLRRAMRSEIHTDKESDMSMQAYYDSITAKTGKTPEQLIELIRAEGLLEPRMKAGQIITWLTENYGLGHGHAMAIVATIKKHAEPEPSTDEKVARHFDGKKAGWRPAYDGLVQKVTAFGPDADVLAGATYLSLRRAGKKFAIVQVTAERLDVGIKLKDGQAHDRLEAAGTWNSMVTHRVRVHRAAEIDQELLGWLERAYATS
jgi:DNA-binding NarL/FixJ family response regulator